MEDIDSILCEVGSRIMVSKEFNELSLNDFMRDWVSGISPSTSKAREPMKVPLCVGKVKLNFDGLSFGNPGPAGFGCVACDDLSDMVFVLCGPLGRCDSTKAELFGLLEGLHMLKELGIYGCPVVGGSKVVVSGKCEGSWQLIHYVHKVRVLIKEFHISPHIPRSRNEVAD